MLPVSLEKIEQDFRFIVLEVTKQLKDTLRLFTCSDTSLIEKISARDDYIDTLKSRIEDHCAAALLSIAQKHTPEREINKVRAINIIGANLERIGDYAVSIVDQLHYLTERDVLTPYKLPAIFNEIMKALNLVDEALFTRDLNLALRICQSEYLLDHLYKTLLNRVIQEIQDGQHVGNRITILFISSYLERIGDALLNIGEAIIFATLGQRLKIHQYQALEESLATSHLKETLGTVTLEPIHNTRSGCSIGQVRNTTKGTHSLRVIFKKGASTKLKKERENVEAWEKILPGLPPRVLSFQNTGRHASMLLEYLGNTTFLNIVLNANETIFREAFLKIQQTLLTIWTTTKTKKPSHANYMNQLASRLPDVFSVHPEFKLPHRKIGSVSVSSLERLIKRAAEIEKKLPAPFSVFIHGDFNIDNIIYNIDSQRLHFIDLHRSCYSDYVQDVSVFLISNFRQPFFDAPIRERINSITMSFFVFARDWAQKNGDETFAARLAIGLARSLISSTRFELVERYAKIMFLRSLYLLERLEAHRGKWKTFEVPQDVLVY